MSKKFNSASMYVLIGVLILVAVIGFGFLGGDNTVSSGQYSVSGQLTISEMSWDIGDVSMADGKHTKDVEISNDSGAPVTIVDMQTSCMCTSVQVVHANGSKSRVKGMAGHGGTTRLSETIEPGEVVVFRIVFDPNAHGPDATGPINRKVMIETDSDAQPEIEFSFMGNVIK